MKLDPAGYGLIPVSEVDPSVLSNFSSTATNLDQFLKNDAKTFHEGRLGYTTCVFHKDVKNLVVGYFTMLNYSIVLNPSEELELGVNIEIPIKNIPAVLLGKFAIHLAYQCFGNGKAIMELAIGEILSASSSSAARLAVVDALNDVNIIKFYNNCGFKNSLHVQKANSNSRTIKMYRDVLA